jgi:transposase-like protein
MRSTSHGGTVAPQLGLKSIVEAEAYLYQCKWPGGFSCPRCEHRHSYIIRTRNIPLYQCAQCRHQTSLTAGTIMEHTRTSLDKWLIALNRMALPGGISAIQLQKEIRVSYKTAWFMLKRVRLAISMMDMHFPLFGSVRAELAFYGDGGRPSLYRNIREHSLVAMASFSDNVDYRNKSCNIKSETTSIQIFEVAAEAEPVPSKLPAYVKLKIANPATMINRRMPEVLQPLFFNKHIHTDSQLNSLAPMSAANLNDERYFLKRVALQAKRWVTETFHGIGAKYLQLYWDEFCFRLNCHGQHKPILPSLTAVCMQKLS